MLKRHYRLAVFLTALSMVAFAVLTTLAVVSGWNRTIVGAGAALSVYFFIRLLRQFRFLTDQVSYFLKALLNKDYTTHYPPTSDAAMREMYSNMNYISQLYRDNQKEIETKKQYYDRILLFMTHELRNSITPIVSLSSDMLKRQTLYNPEMMHEGLEVIHDQCRSVKDFLDSYHRLTHLPSPKIEPIHVHSMFEKLRKLMSQEPGSEALHFQWGEKMIIMADEDLLVLVLTNLIKNAMQAICDYRSALTESDPSAEPAKIEVTASLPGGVPYITVADNGPGIPDDIQSDIFLPFYTTKKEGTGIGLCLSRQIMQLHGGNLEVNSRLGRGATFIMTFSK